MSTERLLEIKSQIDKAIPKQGEVKGQIKGVDDQVEQKFGIKGIPKMKEKLKEIGTKLDGQESGFKKGMEALEGAYGWD